MSAAPSHSTLLDTFTRPHSLIAASVLRIALGAYALIIYVAHIAQRYFLWGPNGAYPFDAFVGVLRAHGGFSLYSLSQSKAYFEAIFWLGLLVSALYTIGLWPRLTGMLSYAFILSLYERNPFFDDGGFNLYVILNFYALFAETGAYFTIGSEITRSRLAKTTTIQSLLNVLHNFAMLFCCVQLCMVYFFSSFYKIMGSKWQNGTALYYILRSYGFGSSALAPWIYRNASMVTAGTYGPLVMQLAFPWLMWNRRAKWYILAAVVVFHASIAVILGPGLYRFSFIVIAADIVFFTDEDLLGLARVVRQVLSAVRRNEVEFRREAPPGPG